MCTRRSFYFQTCTDMAGCSGRSDTQVLLFLLVFVQFLFTVVTVVSILEYSCETETSTSASWRQVPG
jgi:hypothetical protein